MLVFKHDALLTFVDRLIHDREFSEWFVARPEQALASCALTSRDLQDVADVLAVDRFQPDVARALQPTLRFFLAVIDESRGGDEPDQVARRLARFEIELASTRERLATAKQRRPRPWWKLW